MAEVFNLPTKEQFDTMNSHLANISIPDAQKVTIGDAGSHYTSGNVEGALQEVGEQINDLDANKVDNSRVLTDVPVNAKFTDTVTTINGKTGAIAKADIVALGIPSQDTTYSEITTAEIDTGTASTLRTITGRRVKYILDKVSTMISTAISGLTKADVGLGNVDNTSDINKPISSATQTALNGKVDNSRVLTDVPLNAKFTDTTYNVISTAEIDSGTASTSRVINAQRLKYISDKLKITIGTTQPTSGWWFKEI